MVQTLLSRDQGLVGELKGPGVKGVDIDSYFLTDDKRTPSYSGRSLAGRDPGLGPSTSHLPLTTARPEYLGTLGCTFRKRSEVTRRDPEWDDWGASFDAGENEGSRHLRQD